MCATLCVHVFVNACVCACLWVRVHVCVWVGEHAHQMCELSFQKTWHLRNAYNDNQPVKVRGVGLAIRLAARTGRSVQGASKLDEQPAFTLLFPPAWTGSSHCGNGNHNSCNSACTSTQQRSSLDVRSLHAEFVLSSCYPVLSESLSQPLLNHRPVISSS